MRYRNELKFILNSRTAEIIKLRIAGVMARDSHSDGVYTVNNIYFDDQYDTFLSEKQTGSYSRDKLRIRYYNNDLSYICFEIKHKDGQLSYKVKTRLTDDEFRKLKAGDFGFASLSEHPVWQKAAAFNNAGVLRPAAAFSYTREAYVYNPGDVRITFDSTIRPAKLTPMANYDVPLGLEPLMEVKYTGFMPSVIAGMLHGLPLVRTELSKYTYMRQYAPSPSYAGRDSNF